MLLLHKLLIGLGGTAVIGGVGYGIYHSAGNNENIEPSGEQEQEEKIEPSQKGPLDTEEQTNQGENQQTQGQDSGSTGTGASG